MICQALLHWWKRNRLFLEKKLLQEQFDTQLLQNRIEVQEDTFNSLGTELHDNIGQLLSTAKMFIGITERQLDPPPLTLLSANETLDKAITELRDLSKSLNKDWLEQFDLYRNLTTLIARINAAGTLIIQFTKSGPMLPVNTDQQFIFYRLLQEGIQNVIKHAVATHLFISISYDKNHVSASIRDDGIGFNTRRPATGLGMKIMRQRAKILNGTIGWQSSPSGTLLHISFPINPAFL